MSYGKTSKSGIDGARRNKRWRGRMKKIADAVEDQCPAKDVS